MTKKGKLVIMVSSVLIFFIAGLALVITLMIGGGSFDKLHTALVLDNSDRSLFLSPATQNLSPGQEFGVDVFLDTKGQTIGGFTIQLDYDTSVVAIDSSKGTDGFLIGDGIAGYTTTVNPQGLTNGHYIILGVTANDTTASNQPRHIGKVYFKVLDQVSNGISTSLTLSLNELLDNDLVRYSVGSVNGGLINVGEQPSSSVCGNGVVEGNEECDEGNQNGQVCTPAYGETCEYCKSNCTNGSVVGGRCGDGVVNGNEECDDGNTANGDGCSSTCQTEGGGSSSVCGNGVVEGNEECDEGNQNGQVCTPNYGSSCIYCKSNCTNGSVFGGSCGDGVVNGNEECDDGNTANGDGCSSTCQTEGGSSAGGSSSVSKRSSSSSAASSSCDSSIGNYIWYDVNGNGMQDDIEKGVVGVKVCAYDDHNHKKCDKTNKSGRYEIDGLCAGKYTVKVKGIDDMIQTYDPDGKKDNKTKVRLKNNDKHTKADFGYRKGVAPKTGVVTNILLVIALSVMVTVGILLALRKQGEL